jgi:hypothetical protein
MLPDSSRARSVALVIGWAVPWALLLALVPFLAYNLRYTWGRGLETLSLETYIELGLTWLAGFLGAGATGANIRRQQPNLGRRWVLAMAGAWGLIAALLGYASGSGDLLGEILFGTFWGAVFGAAGYGLIHWALGRAKREG